MEKVYDNDKRPATEVVVSEVAENISMKEQDAAPRPSAGNVSSASPAQLPNTPANTLDPKLGQNTTANDEANVSVGVPIDPNDPNQSLKGQKSKLGHRRVDKSGNVTYKRQAHDLLGAAMQLGIVTSLSNKKTPERDILIHDFEVVDRLRFPEEGTNMLPPHKYGDFDFKMYASHAFRYFRRLFGIKENDFLASIGEPKDTPLISMSNPGASGSLFWRTSDDNFIIKTVQKDEATFLRKLLPAYYMNCNQNPRTLLPKFYGLYCIKMNGHRGHRKNIRLLIMNNLLPNPSLIPIHMKFDLKGSSQGRMASNSEKQKSSPTLKDNDFRELFKNKSTSKPEGIYLEKDIHRALIETLKRDCLVLESFKIMDYSLLLAIYNVDRHKKDSVTQTPRDSNSPIYKTGEEIIEKVYVNGKLVPKVTLTQNTSNHQQNSTEQKTDQDQMTSSVFHESQNNQKSSENVVSLSKEEKDRINLIEDHWRERYGSSHHNIAQSITVGPDGRMHSSSGNQSNKDRYNSETYLTNQSMANRNHHVNAGGAAANSRKYINQTLSVNKYQTATGQIMASTSNVQQRLLEEELSHWSGGIPAFMPNGDKLLLYVGIIDILQHYKLKKKIEHHMKSLIYDGDTVSVHRPNFYHKRFMNFMDLQVFTSKKYNVTKSCSQLSSGIGSYNSHSNVISSLSKSNEKFRHSLPRQTIPKTIKEQDTPVSQRKVTENQSKVTLHDIELEELHEPGTVKKVEPINGGDLGL